MVLTSETGAAGDIVRRHAIRNESRAFYLDGLRGLAVTQVIISHYSSFPLHLSDDVWRNSSLFIIINGYVSVYILFALSGYVLTVAYLRRPVSIVASIAQRLVRLGVPMLVALLFAAAILAVTSTYHLESKVAFDRSSSFFAVLHTTYSAPEALKQAATSGMLVGYREATVLPNAIRIAIFDQSNTQSLDPPLWTLHFEFWGSILIIVLVALSRRIAKRTHLCLLAVLAAIFCRHTFLPFLVGHAFAYASQEHAFIPSRAPLLWRSVGVVAAAGAVWVCDSRAWPAIEALWSTPLPFKVYAPFNLQSLYAALLCFAAVMLLPELQRVLATRPLLWLGRISFGLYLLHFPILHTLTLAVFVMSSSRMSTGQASILSALVGIFVSIAAAMAFSLLIDQPSIGVGRWVWSLVAGPAKRAEALDRRAQRSLPSS